MKDQKKKIFNWNHISDKLAKEQIDELKSYYRVYYRKCWAYKQAVKRFKKLNLLGNSMSVIFASSGLAASIATGGTSLVAISTVSLLIQGWMKHQNLDLKIPKLHLRLSELPTFVDSYKRYVKIRSFRNINLRYVKGYRRSRS